MLPLKAVAKLEKRINRLRDWRFAPVADVSLLIAETFEHFRTPPADLDYRPIAVGARWGEEWKTAWFRGVAEVPRNVVGRRIFYRHVSFAEKLLFIDKRPYAGMNPHHPEVLLTDRSAGGERYEIALEAYSGHRIANMDPMTPSMDFHQVCGMDPGQAPPHVLEASQLVAERPATAALYYDAHVLYRAAISLPETSRRRAMLLDGLNEAIDTLPMTWESESELETACAAAREALAPLLAARNAASAPFVGMIGHSHVDLAWLWPLRETFRKVPRTFTTFLRLFEEFPELTYIQSQPVLIDMLMNHYPELLPEVQAAVQRGQWQPNGGMWTEADCNITGGESLVRQFLEARKLTREVFGYESDTLWLPDVFGYSAAIPQIARRCGMDHFVTSKINWNDTTRFPYDTFWWRGLDGTELFTHFITNRTEGYNAHIVPDQVWETWNNVKQKEVQDCALFPTGYGDGGGGITREWCEQGRRMADLDGCPRTGFVNVSQFLKRLREQPIRRARWDGELYLEYHRGTYTTEGRTKRYNRKLELLLRDVEMLSAIALRNGHAYPSEALQRIWRMLLTYQCHDNIAGSCIRQTYLDMEADYAAAQEELQGLRAGAVTALAEGCVPPKSGSAMAVVNTLAWPRDELVVVEDTEYTSATSHDGAPLPVQVFADRETTGLAVRVNAHSTSLNLIGLGHDASPKPSAFTHLDGTLDTPFYAVAFDEAGRITSLYDKAARREIVQAGRALNSLYSAEDLPLYWDGFDIDPYYRDVIKDEDRLTSRKIIADGPLFLTYRSTYKIGRRSTLTQDTTFYAHTRRIDFRTEVDWHERHLLLKTGFAIDVHSPVWRNEIQFGHVVRNRHANTAYDQARFEVYAHKWVDVSESTYGVALLNDCKYGHDCLDDMISLTLLRSVGGVNEKGDEGAHHFTYALLPHDGPFSARDVVREAYALNVPLLPQRVKARGTAASEVFCAVSHPNVVLETVKKAEEDDAVVVRVYEAEHGRVHASLLFERPLAKVVESDLLEREENLVEVEDTAFSFEIRPFEVKTFKVWFG